MNTPITITPYDVLMGLLVIAGIAALILLVIGLIKVLIILGKINKFIDKNAAPLTDSIRNLPEITQNASVISRNVVEITETTGEILTGFEEITGIDSAGEGGLMGIVTVVMTVVQNIIQFFRNLTSKD